MLILLREGKDLDCVAEVSVEFGCATPRPQRQHGFIEEREGGRKAAGLRGEERALKERGAEGALMAQRDALRPRAPRAIGIRSSTDGSELVERYAQGRRIPRFHSPLVAKRGTSLRQPLSAG